MGFFAVRWIEKHGAETEKAALSTPVAAAPAAPPAKTKWFSRKKDTEAEHGGQGTASSKPNRAATIGDTRSMKDSRTTANYATWGSSSKSAVLAATTTTSRTQLQQQQNNGAGAGRKSSVDSYMSAPPVPRVATDSVTVTLAQKLDELATANADGLLSDDEYRMLRQNLFERFGSVAAKIPAEQPLIALPSPLSRQTLNTPSAERQTSSTNALPQGDSNFNISRSKSTRSVRSTASKGSSVQTAITSMIRRATRRESIPRNSFAGSGGNDAESTYSRGSRNSSIFLRGALPRTLVHKASAGSIQTSPSILNGPSAASHAFDVRSISSRRTGKSNVGNDNATIISRTTSRSRPPSSYHRRRPPSETGGSDEIGVDWTTAELRAEIQSLEEENKRLLDMFNGLEMTIQTKYGRPVNGPRSASASDGGGRTLPSDWTLNAAADKKIPAPEKSSSRLSISSSSMRSLAGLQRKGSLSFLSRRSQLPPLPPIPTSATSASTFASAPNSATSMGISPTLPSASSITSSSSLHPHPMAIGGGSHSQSNRSSPNLGLEHHRGIGPSPLSPSSSSSSMTGGGGGKPLTRSRSGYLGTNHGGRDDDVGDPEQNALENSLDDIRRKRATVVLRYEKRLEYLRARLRTAELHERLLK